MTTTSEDGDRGVTAFRPIRLRKAADEVVAVLANAIAGGLYPPGALLPRERDLAARLEVSRTVVREAIGVLRREGVVSVRRGPSGGAMVMSLSNLPRVLASLHGETALSLRSLLEVRRPLELTAALLASERAADEDFRRLRELVDELEGLMDQPADFLAEDVRFHLAVADVSGNPVLGDFVRWVLDRMLLVLSQFPVGRVDLPHALDNQRRTLEAIERRDRALVVDAIDAHMGTLETLFLGRKLKWDGAAVARDGG